MFRLSILLTLSLLALSPSVFAHDVDRPDGWILITHETVTRETMRSRRMNLPDHKVHDHGYRRPNGRSTTHTWYYATGKHLHNYENSQVAYEHDHGEYLVRHSHAPQSLPQNSPPQQQIQDSPVQQGDPPPTSPVQQGDPQDQLGYPPTTRQEDAPTRSYSHDFTHQHDLYDSHTHTVHTGSSSKPTYTDTELHTLVPNDHDGVPRRQDDVTPRQPTNGQPTNTPTNQQPTVGGGGPSPVTEESATSEVTSGPPQPVAPVATQSAPQGTQQVSSPIQSLRVTEYMVRDWSRGAVIGNSNLPQWIELYNPNTEAVNLKGYTFQYATRRFRNQPYKVHTLALAATEDGFSIAAGGVAILSTQKLPARKFSGIEAEQVYNLNIENVLKRGWVLTDANGKAIHRLGREAFRGLRDPVAPSHQDGARVSHHAYLSESPSEPYYYGDSEDIGSPGFYEQPPPAAPSAVKRKRIGTWADLKK